ncbi:hypothetical protein E4T56_gene1433, partial [Termitomyces sp. T112]
LESELALAKQSTDDLTTKLAAIMDERAKILCELDKAQATISSSTSLVAQFKDRLAKTTDDLVKAISNAAESQAKLTATSDQLDSQHQRYQALIAEVDLKQAELALLTQRLSAAESLTERYQIEALTNSTAAQELQERLSAAEIELEAAHDLLSSTRDSHILEKENQTTRISDLEALIQRGRTEIEALQLQLSLTQSERAELQKQVVQHTLQLDNSRTNLVAESQQVTRLEAELVVATEKLQEVEEELLALRSSKAADEATIEGMKEMFSSHVEKQTQSLAVLNSQTKELEKESVHSDFSDERFRKLVWRQKGHVRPENISKRGLLFRLHLFAASMQLGIDTVVQDGSNPQVYRLYAVNLKKCPLIISPGYPFHVPGDETKINFDPEPLALYRLLKLSTLGS